MVQDRDIVTMEANT